MVDRRDRIAVLDPPHAASRAPVAVIGAAAVSAFGLSWRGLGEAVRARAIPGTPAFEVPPIPSAFDAGDARARRSMSRPAQLAAIAAREALAGARLGDEREEIGYFLGVGASGGPVGEVLAMLR